MKDPEVETVVVNKAALVEILRAFNGGPYMLRELQATIYTPRRDIPPNPVKIMMDQVNTQHQNPVVTPTILYLDTEFNGFNGDLISMALVASSGAHWYAALPCLNPEPWVRENVIPVLNTTPVDWQSFVEGLRCFLSQFEEGIHVISDWPEDISNFCRALLKVPGSFIRTPPISFELCLKPSDMQSDIPHNALEDARALTKALTQAKGITA